jgi:hypothetical protein
MPNELLLEAFKFLNASKIATEKMSKSKSWLAHKMVGTDSKGGFDAAEYLKLADIFEGLSKDFQTHSAEFRKQAEDKSLLINMDFSK